MLKRLFKRSDYETVVSLTFLNKKGYQQTAEEVVISEENEDKSTIENAIINTNQKMNSLLGISSEIKPKRVQKQISFEES